MSKLTNTLKFLALITVAIGLFHATLSLSAESLLGANLPESVINDPVLDSQNRFYGIIFVCYGVLVFLAATDLHKYLTLFRVLVGFLFLGGLFRLVSIVQAGLPSAQIIFLIGLELLLPPVLIWWHRSISQQSSGAGK